MLKLSTGDNGQFTILSIKQKLYYGNVAVGYALEVLLVVFACCYLLL